jgi:hypothetical protein
MSLADSNYVPINSFPWYAFNQIRSCVWQLARRKVSKYTVAR